MAADVAPTRWVSLAIPLLSGSAAVWALESTMNTTLLAGTWDDFARLLTENFELGDAAQRAKEKIKSLEYKRGSDIVAFLSDLRSAFTDLAPITEQQKFDYFESCVQCDLITLLREQQQENPDYTFTALSKKLLTLYQVYQSSKAQHSNYPSLLPANQGNHHNNNQRKGSNSGKSGGKPPSGSSKESGSSSTSSGGKSSRFCTYCKKHGHTIDYYRLKKSREAAKAGEPASKGHGSPSPPSSSTKSGTSATRTSAGGSKPSK